MDQGDKLLANGQVPDALKRYRAAHQIMGVPTTGIEVARVQAKLGLLVEARATAIEVANSPASAKEPEVFGEARLAAAELANSLETRIASVTIEIGPPEADTTTKIGDSVIPQAALGLPYKVNPGKHVLSVTAPGYAPRAMDFQVGEGEERVLRMELAKDNSVPAGPVPAAGEPSEAPDTQSTKPEITNAQSTTAATSTSDGAIATQTWVAFGVAAAAGLVGAGAGVYSLVKTNDAKDKCDGNTCPPETRDSIESAKTMAWVANVGFGVAILAAGYGVFTLLTGDDTSEASANSGASKQHQSTAHGIGQFGVAISERGDSAALTWTGAF